MKVILLSGQSLNNRSWIEEVGVSLKSHGLTPDVIHYSHWDIGGNSADVEKETEKLVELVGGINGDYCIFAKSIGSVITFNSVSKLSNLPKFAVMVGVPLNTAKESGYNLNELSLKVNFPVWIYQKRSDPYCSFTDLKAIEGGVIVVKEYECVNEPNNDHHYANMDTIKNIVTNALNLSKP
ncbi:hypothetical protein HYV12_03240 [Candidatus Dojkabacteria bacterium]|nr:hypothetical protein [Candidatus Dojkabacteria bacterium]